MMLLSKHDMEKKYFEEIIRQKDKAGNVVMGGKALQDVLLHGDKRMKNTTQDTSHYVLKAINFINSFVYHHVFTFSKRRNLNWEADDAHQIFNRDQRPQDSPDPQSLALTSLNQL